jgi:hypothetical protein
MTTRITSLMPREQSGPQTGRKYEVQYEEAALSCLKLLEDGEALCVYCEWHDDFVVERNGSSVTYAFHQVKTRADSKGAWSVFEILGVTKPRPAKQPKKVKRASSKAKKKKGTEDGLSSPPRLKLRKGDSIAHRMLDHYRKFSNACAVFVLVSPTEVVADRLLALVKDAAKLASPADLLPESKEWFDALLAAYQGQDATVTEAELWGLISRLDFVHAQASEADPRIAIGLMGQIIHDLSEVDISVTEQGRIAAALLKVVRERSHAVLKTLPDDDEVRSRKAVSLPDVIKLLPLSLNGYRMLKAGQGPVVKSLSRLQRLCRSSGMDDRMIESLCGLKVAWQVWRAGAGDSLTQETMAVLRESGLALLKQLTSGGLSFAELRTRADLEATRLAAVPRMPPAISGIELMGLVFALAAESE